MRMNVFIIFVIAVIIYSLINACKRWNDGEWEVLDAVKSFGGWMIFVCIVYFIFM